MLGGTGNVSEIRSAVTIEAGRGSCRAMRRWDVLSWATTTARSEGDGFELAETGSRETGERYELTRTEMADEREVVRRRPNGMATS